LDYIRSLAKKLMPRLLRALLGFWLLFGPFLVFLIRWKTYEVTLMYVLLVGAFIFVGVHCWSHGAAYLRQLGSNTATALASLLIGGGLSGLIGKTTGVRLHSSMLFLPLVILAGFVLADYYAERKASAAAPAAGSQQS
jgi:hypothetical protein